MQEEVNPSATARGWRDFATSSHTEFSEKCPWNVGYMHTYPMSDCFLMSLPCILNLSGSTEKWGNTKFDCLSCSCKIKQQQEGTDHRTTSYWKRKLYCIKKELTFSIQIGTVSIIQWVCKSMWKCKYSMCNLQELSVQLSGRRGWQRREIPSQQNEEQRGRFSSFQIRFSTSYTLWQPSQRRP